MSNNNVNSKVRTKNGRKLLELCKELKRWTDINSLLNENTDINLTNPLGRSPLHYASEKACLDLMTKLIELGADIHCRENERGFTPLHFAASRGKTPAIKILLEAGADVNTLANHAVTPLHLAARSGPISVVKYLIKEGANVEAREDIFNFSPLLVAAYNSADETIDVLIKKGESNVNGATNEGVTPLHLTSMSGDIKSTRRLVENGANVDSRLNESRSTPLHLASINGFFENIRGLTKFHEKLEDSKHVLENRVPWKHNDDEDYESVVKLLMERGCDLQAKDSSGATALHLAARHRSKVLKTLLKYDADVMAQDDKGRLPFHEAMEHGVGLDWLLRYGADVNDIDQSQAERMEVIMKRCRFRYHLLEHFVKLTAAELPIADVYKPYVEENYYKSYANECHKELQKMKSNQIDDDGTTFYDLLHCSTSPQTTYELPHNVESKFPKYHGILRACSYAPLKRRQLLDSARLAWYHLTNIDLPAICVELILGYLSTADLRIIVRGAKKI